MWWRNIFISLPRLRGRVGVGAAFLLLLLTACGFTPLHGQQNVAPPILKAIDLPAPDNRNQQLFVTALADALNPERSKVPKRYRFSYELEQSSAPLAIQLNRTITRYKVSATVTYRVVDISTGKKVHEGKIRRDSGYDRVESDYATYVSEVKTFENILKELAQDVKIHLTLAMME